MSKNRSDEFIPMKCIYFMLCLQLIPTMLGLSSLLTYISLGIHFLVNDYHLRDVCPDSHLWEYVLLAVILSPLYLIHFFLKKFTRVSLKNKFRVLIFSVITYLALLVFGGFGLYDYNLSCENDEEDLWKFGIASFIFQLLYLFYCFICYLEYILPEEKEEVPVDSPDFELENDVFGDDSYIHQVSEI